MGFPIRTSPDHSSVDSSPRLFAASYVLLRLLVPRHPPSALSNLTTDLFLDARVHYAVLKVRARGSSRPSGLSWSTLEVAHSRPFPQDPTACQAPLPIAIRSTLFRAVLGSLTGPRPNNQCFHLVEQPLRTFVSPALWTGCFHLARCSLERR